MKNTDYIKRSMIGYGDEMFDIARKFINCDPRRNEVSISCRQELWTKEYQYMVTLIKDVEGYTTKKQKEAMKNMLEGKYD